MKAKKLLALFLTALMALTILTACGGGSNKLDMDDVNAKVVSMGGDAVVENDGRLNSAVRAVANEFRRRSTYSAAAANDIMVDLLPNLTWRLSTAVLTEADVLADGGSPEQIAASGCVTQQETNGDGYEYYAYAMSVENADDEVIWIICSWAVLPL